MKKLTFDEYLKTIDFDDIDSDIRVQSDEFQKQARNRLKESSLHRVRKSWMGHDTGTITAYRDRHDCGDGDGITKKDNKTRNIALRSKLSKLGYGYTKIKGSYMEGGKETKEASFFVVDVNDSGNLERDLIKLGSDFDQDSVAFAKSESDYYLISTNNCENNWVGKGKIGVKMNIGSPKFGRDGIEAFSRVNGRSFIFEGFDQITLDMLSVSSLRNMNYVCERYPDKQSILNIGALDD